MATATRPRRVARGRGVRSLLAAAVALSLTLHALALMAGLHLLSYDAHIHTFFASHYLRSPFDLWEPRFYAGFSIASYPPLVHQAMALVAVVAGLDAAFPAILLLVAAALPLALYAWGQAWVSREAAAWGALIGAILPSVGLAAFAFGQLAQLAGMTLALFTLGALNAYLRRGGLARLGLTVALAGTTAAAHHLNVVLFLPLAGAGLTAGALLAGDVPRAVLLRRALLVASLAAAAAALTVLPFGLWTLAYEQQAPIDHASRHNLLADREGQRWFLWPMYAVWPVVLLANLPDLFSRRRVGLAALVGLLATLGLGGATALPTIIYGEWASWLTFDRFAAWAGMAAAPLIGQTFAALWRASAFRYDLVLVPAIEGDDDDALKVVVPATPLAGSAGGPPAVFQPARLKGRAGQRPTLPAYRLTADALLMFRHALAAVALGLGILTFLWAATLHLVHPTQPPLMDIQPVAAFLDEGDHVAWRYLTLGFGDQLARLAAVTEAESIDGNYHTARWLPELRASGIGSLDGSLWWDREARVLRAVLQPELGDALHLRWVVVYRRDYETLLHDSGLQPVQDLGNGVTVWERSGVQPLLVRDEEPLWPEQLVSPAWQGVWWAVAPWTAVLAATGFALMIYRGRSW